MIVFFFQHLIVNIIHKMMKKNSNKCFALLYSMHTFIPVVHQYVPLETFSGVGQISEEYYVTNVLKWRTNK